MMLQDHYLHLLSVVVVAINHEVGQYLLQYVYPLDLLKILEQYDQDIVQFRSHGRLALL